MFFLCLSPTVQSPSALSNVFGVREWCTEEKKKMKKREKCLFSFKSAVHRDHFLRDIPASEQD